MLGQRILDSISAPLYVSPVHQCSPLKYFANVLGRRHVRYQSHRGFFAVLPVQHWRPLLFFRYRAQDTSAKFDTVLRSSRQCCDYPLSECTIICCCTIQLFLPNFSLPYRFYLADIFENIFVIVARGQFSFAETRVFSKYTKGYT